MDYSTYAGVINSTHVRRYPDRIGAFGASIMWMTGNGSEDADEMQFRLTQVGLPASTRWATGMAVSGRAVDGYVRYLDNMLAPMKGAEKGLILVHGPGNSVTAKGPYPGGAEEIYTGMRTVLQGIADRGYTPLYLGLTYRRPQKSKPRETATYNREICWPLIKEFSPAIWDWDNDRPAWDFYRLTQELGPWLQDDNVHPSPPMRCAMRTWWAMKLGELLHSRPAVSAADFKGKRIVFSFSPDQKSAFNNINVMIASNESGSSTGQNSAAGCSRVLTTEGRPLDGVWATSMGYSGHNNKGRTTGTGDTSASIQNETLIAHNLYSGHDDVFEALTIRGLPQGLYGTLTLIASRKADDEKRRGDFWLEGHEHTKYQVDASLNPPKPIKMRFEVQGNHLVLLGQKQPDSEYCYLAGAQLDFDI
ncbi:SGNH/GDSL hydrolase family protein [Larsenimonas rhizosphaerae]|uniref:SGNH/GDSL hydrolase family protein n=1 Tax=Larsenimonas rhizosphaerae TaxID=2944682 RepID=A0AA42CTC7_9GAMM|nr:SGNH/GDSL hydrolase family protein [Larsenimonas rhizosphaerae]MCM2130803.1 SGNH/GDSL hydrolase family protein [Larsenimonas rhizosphaerae]MCX2523507.1 SGNH/GDSL hydrolase family protein [Larsenimonas rhizosphaerae]